MVGVSGISPAAGFTFCRGIMADFFWHPSRIVSNAAGVIFGLSYFEVNCGEMWWTAVRAVVEN